MKIPRLPYCCCCIDLRIGGLITGCLGVVAAIFTIAVAAVRSDPKIVVGAISLILYISWLYGILKVQPHYLLPILFMNVLELSILITLPIVMLLIALTHGTPIVANSIIFAIAIYIASAILAYICILKYSIYRRMVDIKFETVDNQAAVQMPV
ncbi:uncharacterized protein LOC129578833 [Sitodiplosis mosellana]|uniref:uncharacterized protein LOC129578833 n=1 Tax=Sitodiplosis mosellana TaxID=263140 RepID=UPI002444F939|nr:uncharacterized protein LOC129578833 [Sitodiplosis mosellana]